MGTFSNLSTARFQDAMRPYRDEVLSKQFPGCHIEYPIAQDEDVRVWVDKNLAIDGRITLASGRSFTFQEKYRRSKFLYNPNYQVKPPQPDFTQESTNAAGTQYEAEGEWHHLHAEFYFYGWANKDETGFDKWILLDVWKYKRIVWKAGGLGRIGDGPIPNGTHGAAEFYAIPVCNLEDAILCGEDLRLPCPECSGTGRWSCPVGWPRGHNNIPVCSEECECPPDKNIHGLPECTCGGTWREMPKRVCAECGGWSYIECAQCDGAGMLPPPNPENDVA